MDYKRLAAAAALLSALAAAPTSVADKPLLTP